jgi:hypothetical protein
MKMHCAFCGVGKEIPTTRSPECRAQHSLLCFRLITIFNAETSIFVTGGKRLHLSHNDAGATKRANVAD